MVGSRRPTGWGLRLQGGTALSSDIGRSLHGLSAHPNPVIDQLKVEHAGGPAPRSIRIFDLLGRLVLKHTATPGSIRQVIDVNRLPPGSYTIELDGTRRSIIIL